MWITNSAESGLWLVFANINPIGSDIPVSFTFTWKAIILCIILCLFILCPVDHLLNIFVLVMFYHQIK